MKSKIRSVLVTLLVLAVAATLALAHNPMVKSSPAANAVLTAAPATLEIWFAEKPDPAVSKITITGPAGAVATSAVRVNSEKSLLVDIQGKLADGKYTVAYQTAGDDGHVTPGTFSFSVKSAE